MEPCPHHEFKKGSDNPDIPTPNSIPIPLSDDEGLSDPEKCFSEDEEITEWKVFENFDVSGEST